MKDPPKGFFRLSPGKEVRLRYAYIIRCDEVIEDEKGNVIELRCTYDEKTPLGENPSDGRRIKGTIHWVSAADSLPIEAWAYDRLFTVENPGTGEHEDFLAYINPESLVVYDQALIEPSVKDTPNETHFQFERQGYFVKEPNNEKLRFNRTVALKDSWSKQKKTQKPVETKPVTPPKETPTIERVEITLTPEQETIAQRYQKELPREYAVLLAQNSAVAEYFDEAIQVHNNPKGIANWVINELLREWKENEKEIITPENLALLVKNIDEEIISTKIAKEVFQEMIATKKSPETIIEEKGLKQISNEKELIPLIEKLIADHPDVVEQIKAGRTNKVSFFVGQIMKATKGQANPKIVNRLLNEKVRG